MAKAGALLSDMQQDSCQPNTITYSSLAKGYCACSDWNSAFSLFHKMVGLGLEADAVIFNTLLDGCVQKGNWALGDEWLAEMQHLNVAPSNFTLSILVKMWSKRGDLDKALECVNAALQDPAGYRRVDAQAGACIVRLASTTATLGELPGVRGDGNLEALRRPRHHKYSASSIAKLHPECRLVV